MTVLNAIACKISNLSIFSRAAYINWTAVPYPTKSVAKCNTVANYLLYLCIRKMREESAFEVKTQTVMKKTYEIEVDCASCANLMEVETKKIEGVSDAVVNFMTQKMIVEFADGADEKKVMKAVLKACKKVEPDCEISL